jgi:hypothetical protein
VALLSLVAQSSRQPSAPVTIDCRSENAPAAGSWQPAAASAAPARLPRTDDVLLATPEICVAIASMAAGSTEMAPPPEPISIPACLHLKPGAHLGVTIKYHYIWVKRVLA